MGKKLRLDIEHNIYDDLLILHVTSRRGMYRPKEFFVEQKHLLRIIDLESKRVERIDGSFEIHDRNGMFMQLLNTLNLKGLAKPLRKSWTEFLDQLDLRSQSFDALDRTQEARKETEHLLKKLEKRGVKHEEDDVNRNGHLNDSHTRNDFERYHEDVENEKLDLSEHDERSLWRV